MTKHIDTKRLDFLIREKADLREINGRWTVMFRFSGQYIEFSSARKAIDHAIERRKKK